MLLFFAVALMEVYYARMWLDCIVTMEGPVLRKMVLMKKKSVCYVLCVHVLDFHDVSFRRWLTNTFEEGSMRRIGGNVFGKSLCRRCFWPPL
jgi:hypothetical protein